MDYEKGGGGVTIDLPENSRLLEGRRTQDTAMISNGTMRTNACTRAAVEAKSSVCFLSCGPYLRAFGRGGLHYGYAEKH